MKSRESIDYAVECVMLLLWGGVIVDWIFSAAPICLVFDIIRETLAVEVNSLDWMLYIWKKKHFLPFFILLKKLFSLPSPLVLMTLFLDILLELCLSGNLSER